MNDPLDELRDEIRLTDDPEEKYQLLFELIARHYAMEEHHSGIEAARKALALAEQLGNKIYRSRSLYMLSKFYRGTADFKASLSHGRKALKLFQALEDRGGEANQLLTIGTCYVEMCDYPQALETLEQGREVLLGLNLPGTLANVLMIMAHVHGILGNLHRSLEYQLQGLEILESRDDLGLRPNMLMNIGCTYYDAAEFDDAEKYMLMALAASRTVADKYVERRALSNLGRLYSEMRSRPDLALEYLQQALQIARDVDDRVFEVLTLSGIGRIHLLRKEYDTALEFLTTSRDAAESRGDTINQLLEMWTIGSIRIEQGNVDDGIKLLQQALDLCNRIEARNKAWEIHRDLARAFESQGNIPLAFEHYKQFAEIKEEVMGNEQQRAIDNLRTRHEIDTAHKEKEIFRLENEKLHMDLQHKSNELTSMALHLVQKNEVLEKLKDEVVQMVNAATADAKPLLKRLVPIIQESIGTEQEWSAFEQQFTQVHPGFFDAILSRAHDLSPAELRVAALLRAQMSTKDIATIMSVTTRAIEKHRLHLRKKLELPAEVNLPAYLAGV